VWGPHLAKDIQLVEAVQGKAARSVLNNYKRTASVPYMINKLGWESLESRREKSRLNLMNKIVCGRVAEPLEEYITRGSTRTSLVDSDKFKLCAARTLGFKNSFFPRTIHVWNKTPKTRISDLDEDRGQIVNILN